MPRFQDIPQFISGGTVGYDISWPYLAMHITRAIIGDYLDINPPFQRTHVWTRRQQVAYVEYILKGGLGGHDIYTNCPRYTAGGKGLYVLVDGKQRIEAVLGFLSDEFPACGYYRSQYTNAPTGAYLRWHVNELKTYPEVLQWYIDLNTGGTVHSEEEISRVRALLAAGDSYAQPSPDILQRDLRRDRAPIEQAYQKLLAEEATTQVRAVSHAKETTKKAKQRRMPGQ